MAHSTSLTDQPRVAWFLDAMLWAPFAPLAVDFLTIGWGFHPSDAFLHLSLPLGLVACVVFAWMTQPMIVGRWYKPRSGNLRRYDGLGAWVRALLGSAVPVFALAFILATLGNALFGHTCVNHYVVRAHYMHRGRYGTCYGIDLDNPANRDDDFSACVGKNDQIVDSLDAIMLVHERTSWFGHRVFSYRRDDAPGLD
jgi:hypothetical protein